MAADSSAGHTLPHPDPDTDPDTDLLATPRLTLTLSGAGFATFVKLASTESIRGSHVTIHCPLNMRSLPWLHGWMFIVSGTQGTAAEKVGNANAH